MSSGFKDAPVSRGLVFSLISVSLLVSVLDLKHYFYIHVVPHIWTYHQIWRVLIYQLAFTNSTEVLFGAFALYHLRVIERIWGSRKFASFICLTYSLTALLPPILLILIARPLSFHKMNYLPAGPTPLIFAILAQYHGAIPHMYKYRIATSPASSTNQSVKGLTFSDKSVVYLFALQLSLSQFPGSIVSAFVGWAVGHSFRNEVLPGSATRWRVPGWLVGVKGKQREDFEGLRRRLEGENTAAATGSDGRTGGIVGRRTLGRQLIDEFRGTP